LQNRNRNVYLRKIYRTKIKDTMNKAIPQEVADRIKKCVFDMNNKMNCYQVTGIHFTTIERILTRLYAKEEQIKTLTDYCDQVEGLTIQA